MPIDILKALVMFCIVCMYVLKNYVRVHLTSICTYLYIHCVHIRMYTYTYTHQKNVQHMYTHKYTHDTQVHTCTYTHSSHTYVHHTHTHNHKHTPPTYTHLVSVFVFFRYSAELTGVCTIQREDHCSSQNCSQYRHQTNTQ